MKKLCAAALAVLMLISVMPAAVFAADTDTLGIVTFDNLRQADSSILWSGCKFQPKSGYTPEVGEYYGSAKDAVKISGKGNYIEMKGTDPILPVDTTNKPYRVTSFDIAFEETTSYAEMYFSTSATSVSGTYGTQVFKNVAAGMQMYGGSTMKTGVVAKTWYRVEIIEQQDGMKYSQEMYVNGQRATEKTQSSEADNRQFATGLLLVRFNNISDAGDAFYIDNFNMKLCATKPVMTASPAITTDYTVTGKNIEIYTDDTVEKVVSEIKNISSGYSAEVFDTSETVLGDSALAVGNYLSINAAGRQYVYYLYGTKTRLDVTGMSGLTAVTSDSQTVTAVPVFTNKMPSTQNVCLVLSVIKEDAVNGDVLKNTVIKNCTVDTDGTIKENGEIITSISVTADTGDTVEFYALNTLDMTQPAKLVISKIYSN